MKHLLTGALLAAALALPARDVAPGQRLAVTINPQFNGEPLAFDALTNRLASGQMISVTRLDFLLSNIALRQADGGWLGLTNWFAYVSPREGRTGFELNNIPAGRYVRLRFQVGVPAEINHRDPADYRAQHPLNPNLNGLHWNWQGGYVFLALEGRWRQGDGEESGYAYHVATDRLLITVAIPVALELTADQEIALALNVDRIFSGTHAIRITSESATTHSREDDSLADHLRDHLQQAFMVESVRPTGPAAVASSGTHKVETTLTQ
jgi:hypothetical protein